MVHNMFYQILGLVLMFEFTPFLGFKISFWEGFRIHILFFEFGFINSEISVSDYFRRDLPEFGVTFGIDKAFPSFPDIYFSIWDLNFHFRLFPKFRKKQEVEFPINDMVVHLDFQEEKIQTVVSSCASVVYIDYSFLGITFSREFCRFRFDRSVGVVNKFTGKKIDLIGLYIPQSKELSKTIPNGEFQITLRSTEIDPTMDRYITSLDV